MLKKLTHWIWEKLNDDWIQEKIFDIVFVGFGIVIFIIISNSWWKE